MEKEGKVYTVNTIINAFKGIKETKTLFDVIEERIGFFVAVTQQYNTATSYRTLYSIIKNYVVEDVDLFAIDVIWLRNFEFFLRQRYKDTSIKKYFDCLRALFNYAVLKKYIQKSPFDDFCFSKKLDTKTKKRALNQQELSMLRRYYFEKYGMLGEKDDAEIVDEDKHYWNKSARRRGVDCLERINVEKLSLSLFLASYSLQGLAMIDLANLKWGMLKELKLLDEEKYVRDVAKHGVTYADANMCVEEYFELQILRQKTSQPVRIVVLQGNLLPFINFSDGEDDEYVFPIFSEEDDTSEKKYGRMRYATSLVNQTLKRVAKKIGINDDITFYSARHSYASALYHENVPLGLIAQNMGRSVVDIETYLKDFAIQQIIKANEASYFTGQKAYLEAKAKVRECKPINEEQVKYWEEKAMERAKLLEQYGGLLGYQEKVNQGVLVQKNGGGEDANDKI